jgi:hypothetical protein
MTTPLTERCEAAIDEDLRANGFVSIQWETEDTTPQPPPTRTIVDRLKITDVTRVRIETGKYCYACLQLHASDYRHPKLFACNRDMRREAVLRFMLAETEAMLPRLRAIVASLDAKENQ